jgi:exopolyphosphatase/guanosine-5'-triphosphate,3'-diphosphate pyrophosphatase
MLVADVAGDRLDEVVRRETVTRLGEGVDADRRLRPAAVERVRAVLARYAGEIAELGAERTLAVATSAVRDAAGGRAFLREITKSTGLPTRLLSGAEEAELTLRRVGLVDDGVLLLDVGGGSTELVTTGSSTSLDVGSVRLTERFLVSDPPEPSELDGARSHVRALLPDLDVTSAIGVAGTVAQLVALAGRLTPTAVETELHRLAVLDTRARRKIAGLDPARAPVIVGGTLIVAEVLRRYELDELVYSVRDLLDGVALELAHG